MPYVVRDSSGHIVSVHAQRNETAHERVDAASHELQAFLGRVGIGSKVRVHKDLAASDIDMIRVLEDLIAVLIDKRVIMLTDLPAAAQDKLSRRFGLRSRLKDLGGILSETEEVLLP